MLGQLHIYLGLGEFSKRPQVMVVSVVWYTLNQTTPPGYVNKTPEWGQTLKFVRVCIVTPTKRIANNCKE